jgi:hypothetical protein
MHQDSTTRKAKKSLKHVSSAARKEHELTELKEVIVS